MFTKIEIKNFKSHKHTIIDLAKGVTVITGRGQAGKTNIKRAIEWLWRLSWTTRPAGNKVHSRWMGKGDITSVSVTNTQGDIITARKPFEDSIEYEIVWAPQRFGEQRQKEIYKKVGTTVPDIIKNLLNLSDINLQGQFDEPFLITSNDSLVSKEINKVIDVEKADEWLKELNSRRTKTTTRINILEEEKTKTEEQLTRYKGAERAENFIIAAEKLQMKKDTTMSLYHSLFGAIQGAKKAMARQQVLKPVKKAVAAFNAANELFAKHQTLQNQWDVIIRAVTQRNTIPYLKHKKQEAEDNYIKTLKEMGVCPFCFGEINEENIRKHI